MSWRRFLERRRRDENFARETESYMDHEIEENVARGMAPQEARSTARRKFGNAARVRETVYDQSGRLTASGHDPRVPGWLLARSDPPAIGTDRDRYM